MMGGVQDNMEGRVDRDNACCSVVAMQGLPNCRVQCHNMYRCPTITITIDRVVAGQGRPLIMVERLCRAVAMLCDEASSSLSYSADVLAATVRRRQRAGY